MKKVILTFIVVINSMLSCPLFAQTDVEPVALGLPGDNFNLYAVLDVFQKSKTLEDFERAINDNATNINNLDLNNDNYIDYIGVISHKEGDSYSIILRDIINNKEFQDIAVIEVNKIREGSFFVQIIGDETLYGKNYIVEPSGTIYSTKTANPAYIEDDDYSRGNLSANVVFYIDDWPLIVRLFSPSFVIYVSPWYWNYYPIYWRPWIPVRYYTYWNYHYHYYRNPVYRRAVYIRYPVYYSNYVKRRSVSPVVRQNIRSRNYNSTYEGRTYKKPATPTTRTIKEENRRQVQPRTNQETRQRTQPTNREKTKEETKSQVLPRTNQETRQRTQPANRQKTKEDTRRQVQPRTNQETRKQTQSIIKNENREQTREQVRPVVRPERVSTPSEIRRSERKINQATRQTARENKRESRSEN